MRKLKIDRVRGEIWPITAQQITVWMGEMMRLAESSGTNESLLLESIVIAVGRHFAKKRGTRSRAMLEAYLREAQDKKAAGS